MIITFTFFTGNSLHFSEIYSLKINVSNNLYHYYHHLSVNFIISYHSYEYYEDKSTYNFVLSHRKKLLLNFTNVKFINIKYILLWH